MITWIAEMLRKYPEIAIYLALALGFFVGSIKIGKFSLGSVTGVLLMGVLIGQLNITISPQVKSVFFLMFLFAVGYGVGPQFFRGLRSDGIPQVLFAVVICVAVLLSTFVAAKIAGYHMGLAAGLLSGAATISAVLGVAGDTINNLGLPPDQAKAYTDAMPVAYAVTYLFGTAGSAWFLASIGPKLLGVDLVRACKEYEDQLGGVKTEAGGVVTYPSIVLRAYRIPAGSKFVGRKVEDLETSLRTAERRAYVQRARHGGAVMECDPGMVIGSGDILAVSAQRQALLANESDLGAEVDDRELLDFPAETVDLVVTKKELEGKTLLELATQYGRGLFLSKVTREGQELPLKWGLKVDRGDVLRVVGPKGAVARATDAIGYADRPTEKTDVVFMGLGIVVGALIGALSFAIGGVPLSLSTSGGALIAGLVCGYLRSVNRTFGRIPEPALWAFNNIGLTVFIAVVGISTGPKFVSGIKEAGISLFLWGIFVTLVPFIIGIYSGKYIFKFHPGILLGACAGSRTTTAALGAVQEEAKSNVPALGYTVTYAVGNTLLIVWGVVIVLMMK
jgi:putative transport protein